MESEDSKPIVTVLVVDDSRAEQLLLTHILNSDPRIRVVGTADNGREAIDFLKHTKPHVITMDLNMPEMDGLSATKEIMAVDPVPIIIVTMDRSWTTAAHALTMMEAGAVALVEKPFTAEEARQEEATKHLLRVVKNLSQVKLVHRVSYQQGSQQYPRSAGPKAAHSLLLVEKDRKPIRAIAIGASTGGPPLLKALVDQFPEVLPVPVFITQHMSPGFTEGFSHWLRRDLKHPLIIPKHGDVYRAGCIYLAPCQQAMGVEGNGHIILSPQTQGAFGFHSVSFLFKCFAREFGSDSLAILLTGMGTDGARELKELRTLGAITVAQDEQSSVVHGMPGEAIRLNGATHIMSPEQIARLINQACSAV